MDIMTEWVHSSSESISKYFSSFGHGLLTTYELGIIFNFVKKNTLLQIELLHQRLNFYYYLRDNIFIFIIIIKN